MTEADEIVSELGYRPFDADNHYYEAEDAFTRHLDPRLGSRVIEWCQIGKRRYHVIGGVVNRDVTNPTFDPVSPAGAMAEYFRGNASGKSPVEYLGRPEPIRPEYRDRDARVRTMDAQSIDKMWLFPTLGILYEEHLKNDPEAVTLLFTAFNRWLLEDWGFAYQDRIFASPCISLCDIDWAIRELEWALDNDARSIVMRPAPIQTAHELLPPADPTFDPFWARVNEAGITVVAHAGNTGFSIPGYARPHNFQTGGASGGFRMGLGALHIEFERVIHDFLGSVMVDRLFERFPNIRMASVESGSGFLGDLFKKLRSAANKHPGYFEHDPVERFRENVWINPFWEDDIHEVVELMGPERVIFGSDWPHIEGLEEPLDYVRELKEFDSGDKRQILLENATALNERVPA
ncbi:MAG: amidohydrolase family protein [Acidimicrobiales bacterium]|nr:amidohydrolase family protein [Acidimicrobiales bacterium]